MKANVSYSFRGGPRCESWTVDAGGWFQMVHPGLVKYYQSTGLPHCLAEPVIHRNYPALFHLLSFSPFCISLRGVDYRRCSFCMQETHSKWIEREISLYHAVRYNVNFVNIYLLHVLQMWKYNVTLVPM